MLGLKKLLLGSSQSWKAPLKGSKSILAIGLMAMLVSFTACSSDDDNDYVDPDVSGFMALNLITDQYSVGASLSGNLVGPPLLYRQYTGGYFRIYPGKRSTDSYSGHNRNTLATTTYDYKPDKYYSLFMVGKDDNYENIIVEDNLDSLRAGNNIAFIRYFNAVAGQDAPDIRVKKDSMTLHSGHIEFGDISPFIKTESGKVSVKIKNGAKIDTSRTIELESGKAYTLLLAGDPDEKDEDHKVQIRYIENGNVVNDSISANNESDEVE